MERHFEPGEQRLGRLLEACENVPPAMAGELALEVAPEALKEFELWRVDRQRERLALVCMGAPSVLHGVALVVARVIEHYHERLVSRQRVGQLVE